jgi:hypothetical protein
MRAAGEITEPLFEEMSNAVRTRLAESEVHLAELTRTVRGVRAREARVASHRLASVQQRVLAEASRSGRISNSVARELADDVEIPIEEWHDPGDDQS